MRTFEYALLAIIAIGLALVIAIPVATAMRIAMERSAQLMENHR